MNQMIPTSEMQFLAESQVCTVVTPMYGQPSALYNELNRMSVSCYLIGQNRHRRETDTLYSMLI